MSRNVWNRPSGSFMVDMGISSNIMKSPSLHTTLHQFWTYHRTGPYYQFWPCCRISGGFHGTLRRMRLANRGRLLLRAPVLVPFGTGICSNVETILFWTCHIYGLFEFRTSLGTSILLWVPVYRFDHTWWMAVVNSTDRHEKVRNRCVIKACGVVLVLSFSFLNFLLV